MKKQIDFLTCKIILTVVICFVLSLSAFANSEKNQLLIAQNLSKKLQSDLGNSSVQVKINNLKEYKISKNEIALKGDAVCILAGNNDHLPIEFQAKVDSVKQSVLDVKYDFVKFDSSENTASYALTSNEEILMKELMTKIRKDYKTENIVIAIDSVESVGTADSENKFLGFGEVRIGDLVWSKIKFDVEFDQQKQKASKIIYKVEN